MDLDDRTISSHKLEAGYHQLISHKMETPRISHNDISGLIEKRLETLDWVIYNSTNSNFSLEHLCQHEWDHCRPTGDASGDIIFAFLSPLILLGGFSFLALVVACIFILKTPRRANETSVEDVEIGITDNTGERSVVNQFGGGNANLALTDEGGVSKNDLLPPYSVN